MLVNLRKKISEKNYISGLFIPFIQINSRSLYTKHEQLMFYVISYQIEFVGFNL